MQNVSVVSCLDFIEAEDYGYFEPIELLVKPCPNPPFGIGIFAEIVAGNLYWGSKDEHFIQWNNLLNIVNTTFALFKVTSRNTQHLLWIQLANHLKINEENIQDLAPGSCKKYLFIHIQEYDEQLFQLLELIPESSDPDITAYHFEYDPISKLTYFNLANLLGESYYFFANSGLMKLLLLRTKIPCIIQSVLNKVEDLARQQAPYTGIRWLSQSQQALYAQRMQVIAQRKQQFSHLEIMISLYILSMLSQSLVNLEPSVYVYCQAIAKKLVLVLSISLSQKILFKPEKKALYITKLTDAIVANCSCSYSGYLHIICLYNNFNHPNNPITFIDFLDKIWAVGGAKGYQVVFSDLRANVIKKYPELVISVIYSAVDFFNGLEKITAFFSTTDIYKLLQNSLHINSALKILSQLCVEAVYYQQFQNLPHHYHLQSPLDFYVGSLLPRIVIADENSQNLNMMMHLVLHHYYVRNNAEMILVLLVGVIINPNLTYDIQQSPSQINQSILIKQIIVSYLKQLKKYCLSENQECLRKLIRNLLKGNIAGELLDRAEIEADSIVGYPYIEAIVAACFLRAHLQIFMDYSNQTVDVRKILRSFFQQILRDDIIDRYRLYQVGDNFKHRNNLIIQLKLAKCYLYTEDMFIKNIESSTNICISLILHCIQKNKFTKSHVKVFQDNYKALDVSPEKLEMFKSILEQYLRNFKGEEISLKKLFFSLGRIDNNHTWNKTGASFRYFNKIINYYFTSAIISQDEPKYFSLFQTLFHDFNEHVSNLKCIFSDNLMHFYRCNPNWLLPILRSSEAFLMDKKQQIKIRSEIFLTLFNDENNIQGLYQFIRTIKNFHAQDQSYAWISKAAKEFFIAQLDQQSQQIKAADIYVLSKIVMDEKWLMLILNLFSDYSDKYIMDLLAALLKHGNNESLNYPLFMLMVGNLVKQLPREDANQDRVKITNKDYLFKDYINYSWSQKLGLLIKHFGSEQLAQDYYLHTVVYLMQSRDVAICYNWKQEFHELYSTQAIKQFQTQSVCEVLNLYVKYLEPKLLTGVKSADFAIADVLKNTILAQKIMRERLSNIMHPNPDGEQITEFLIIKDHFYEYHNYPHYNTHHPEETHKVLNQLLGDSDCFVAAATIYLQQSIEFKVDSIAMTLLQEYGLQQLLLPKLRKILVISQQASVQYSAILQEIKAQRVYKIWNKLKHFWQMQSANPIKQRHIEYYYIKILSDMMVFGVSLLLQKLLLIRLEWQLPDLVIQEIAQRYLRSKFMAKNYIIYLQQKYPVKWLLAQAYTALYKAKPRMNVANSRENNREIRRALQSYLAFYPPGTEQLTEVECLKYLKRVNETQIYPSNIALQLVFGVNGDTKKEISKNYIAQYANQDFKLYFNTDLIQTRFREYCRQHIIQLPNNHKLQNSLKKIKLNEIDDYFKNLSEIVDSLNKNIVNYDIFINSISSLLVINKILPDSEYSKDCLTILKENILNSLDFQVINFNDYLPFSDEINRVLPGLLPMLCLSLPQCKTILSSTAEDEPVIPSMRF